MIEISQRDIEFARRCVWKFTEEDLGKPPSTTFRHREMIARNARTWLAGLDAQQSFANRKFLSETTKIKPRKQKGTNPCPQPSNAAAKT